MKIDQLPIKFPPFTLKVSRAGTSDLGSSACPRLPSCAVHVAIEAAETHFLGSLYHFAAMDGVTAAHLRETILATVSRRPEVRTAGTMFSKRCPPRPRCAFQTSSLELPVIP